MSSNKVRVAIIGVGNCASSLVQGVQFYHNAPDRKTGSAGLDRQALRFLLRPFVQIIG